MELNHPKIKPLSKEKALDLGLSSAFADFIFSDSKPECFDYWVETTDESWTCYISDEVIEAYPLWSTNADETLICIGENRQWFVKGYHDDPRATYISETHQGLLADLFVTIYEQDNTEDADLIKAAESCGFNFIDKIFEFVALDYIDYKTYKLRLKKLIEEVDGSLP